MKILLSLFLIAAGAGFAFHDQLQTWLRAGKDEVYYLRVARQTTNSDGTTVRWAPGQPLRTTARASAAEGSVALTDGKNVLQVPRNVLTRDADEAATLRQTNLSGENTARVEAARQANEEFLADNQSARSYRSGPVSTASAPVYYYPVPVYVAPAPAPGLIVQNRAPATNRASAAAPPVPRHRDHPPRPAPTPSR